jgi:hypothetical protein
MEGVIEKDLLKILLQLESDQQQQVLAYVEDLLIKKRLNNAAEASEADIAAGRVQSLDEFKAEAREWVSSQKATG